MYVFKAGRQGKVGSSYRVFRKTFDLTRYEERRMVHNEELCDSPTVFRTVTSRNL